MEESHGTGEICITDMKPFRNPSLCSPKPDIMDADSEVFGEVLDALGLASLAWLVGLVVPPIARSAPVRKAAFAVSNKSCRRASQNSKRSCATSKSEQASSKISIGRYVSS